MKQRVGVFDLVIACRQPHLEHLGVFVYVSNKGDSGSLIEKNVWFLMFLSDIISQNLNNECCSSGLGWVSKTACMLRARHHLWPIDCFPLKSEEFLHRSLP